MEILKYKLIDNFSPTMVADLQHAPTTSVDVERSFGTYIKKKKKVLTF